ncbi:MAG TPA: proline racemase family protein [Rhodanobacteraceae bacterium]|nr:proline racemase family protein [Rhodanobacteraceae bacterium]
MHTLDFIDSHTGGEPTRVITAGFPDLGGGSMAARLQRFRSQFDDWRRAIVLEPRGSDTLVGAVLLAPLDPRACAGVIFFNNVGPLGMCGHGSIGVVRSLQHLGRIAAGCQPLETPVGTVMVELLGDGRVAVDNVESWRLAADVRLEVPGYGRVRGDVAWGGNWFFITGDCPLPLEFARRHALTAYARAIRAALVSAGVRGAEGAEIDHIEINAAVAREDADAVNFVLCPGDAYDRSPCGTGTSAKLACLAADGKLAPGQRWRQAGIVGSVFEASYQPGVRGVMPRIVGSAHLTAIGQQLIDVADPLAWGIDA